MIPLPDSTTDVTGFKVATCLNCMEILPKSIDLFTSEDEVPGDGQKMHDKLKDLYNKATNLILNELQ